MQSTTRPGRIEQLTGEPDPEGARELELDRLHYLREVGAGKEQHANGDDEQDGEAARDHLHRGDRPLGARARIGDALARERRGRGVAHHANLAITIPLSASTRPPTETASPVT